MKYLLASGIGLILIAIILAVDWFYIPTKLTVTVQPPDSQVKIDDQSVNPSSTVGLRSGQYTIEVSKTGYSSQQYNLKTGWRKQRSVAATLTVLPRSSGVMKGVTTAEWDAEGKNLLLAADEGKTFYRYNPTDGQKTAISRLDFGVVQKAKWSPNRFLVVIWKEDGTAGLVDLKRYDLVNQEFHPWGKGYLDLAWSPDGKEVVYLYKPGSGEFSLVRADASNQNMTRLYDLRSVTLTNPYLEWTPDGKQLLIADQDIYIYTFYTHELKKLTSGGRNQFGYLSPDGQAVIYGTPEGIWRREREGGERRLGEGAGAVAWLGKSRAMIVYRSGELSRLDSVSGEETAYGYNGNRLAAPQLIKADDKTLYWSANQQLERLSLQPRVIRANL